MKLSFSIPQKQSSRPNPLSHSNFNDEDTVSGNENGSKLEFLTEFDPSKAPLQCSSKRSVIPPKQNEWMPGKKMKNIDAPLLFMNSNQKLSFEVESASGKSRITESSINYGLTLRKNPTEIKSSLINDGDMEEYFAHHQAAIGSEDRLLEKLKDDIRILPEDGSVEDFNDVPVEGFGAALLAGYGWSEGKGIGRNASSDIQVFQVNKRTDKQGLGFFSAQISNNKTRELSVRDVNGDKEVHKVNENRIKKDEQRKGDGVDAGGSRNHKTITNGADNKKKKKKRDRVLWLARNIKVKVISKDLRGGRLYLKKGEVVDVVGPSICDISMDENRQLIQGVDQELLETVLPRRGGRVMILYGRHKGVLGNIFGKDLDKETCVVQDAGNQELLYVNLEQVSEYIGDPSHADY